MPYERSPGLSGLAGQGLDEGNTNIDKINQFTVDYCAAIKAYIAGDWVFVRSPPSSTVRVRVLVLEVGVWASAVPPQHGYPLSRAEARQTREWAEPGPRRAGKDDTRAVQRPLSQG
jgi:hypothetical protein